MQVHTALFDALLRIFEAENVPNYLLFFRFILSLASFSLKVKFHDIPHAFFGFSSTLEPIFYGPKFSQLIHQEFSLLLIEKCGFAVVRLFKVLKVVVIDHLLSPLKVFSGHKGLQRVNKRVHWKLQEAQKAHYKERVVHLTEGFLHISLVFIRIIAANHSSLETDHLLNFLRSNPFFLVVSFDDALIDLLFVIQYVINVPAKPFNSPQQPRTSAIILWQ